MSEPERRCLRCGCVPQVSYEDCIAGAEVSGGGLEPHVFLDGGPCFTRASGETVCGPCGEPYRRHPMGGPEGYDGLFLHRLCDGRLVKL